jgi:hypothetical protein
LNVVAAPIVSRPSVQLDNTRNCVNVNWGTNAVNNGSLTYEL